MESFKFNMPINPNPLEKQPAKEPQVREGTQERICPECMVALDASDVCHSLSCENLNKKVLEPIVATKEEGSLELSNEEIFEGEIPPEKIHDIELSNVADQMARYLVDIENPEFYKVAGELDYRRAKTHIESFIKKEMARPDRNFDAYPGKEVEFLETLVSYCEGLKKEESTAARREVIDMVSKVINDFFAERKDQFKNYLRG